MSLRDQMVVLCVLQQRQRQNQLLWKMETKIEQQSKSDTKETARHLGIWGGGPFRETPF